MFFFLCNFKSVVDFSLKVGVLCVWESVNVTTLKCYYYTVVCLITQPSHGGHWLTFGHFEIEAPLFLRMPKVGHLEAG